MSIPASKTKAKDPGNLYQEYDPEFMAQYPGCQHLDCMPECNLATGFCARLQVAFERWLCQRREQEQVNPVDLEPPVPKPELEQPPRLTSASKAWHAIDEQPAAAKPLCDCPKETCRDLANCRHGD